MLWALVGLLGLVMPTLIEWLVQALFRLWPAWAGHLSGTLGLVLVLTPMVLPGLYMARCCQHRGVVFAGGALVGGVYAGSSFAVQVARYGWAGPGSAFAVLSVLFVAALVGTAHVVMLAFYRRYVGRLIIYDGTQCVGCGYCVSHTTSAECPECGLARDTPMKPFGRIYRFAQGLRRHRVLCALILATGATAAVGTLAWRTWPVWQLRATLPIEFEGIMGRGRRVFVVDIPQEIRSVAIDFDYSDPMGDLGMVIRLSTLINAATGGWDDEGTVRVHARLSPAQARAVLDGGVPDSLVRAMLDAADAEGWQPPPPGGMFPPGPVIDIDPDAHFQSESVQ